MDYMTDNDSYISYHLKTGQGLERAKGFFSNRVLLGREVQPSAQHPTWRSRGSHFDLRVKKGRKRVTTFPRKT